MGVLIYVTGDGNITGTAHKETIDDIRAIKDVWGNDAFQADEQAGTFWFRAEGKEGSDPVNDGVIVPLKALLGCAKESGLCVTGDFFVSSDWSDHNNICIRIRDSVLSVTQPCGDIAPDDDLIQKLHDDLTDVLSSMGYDVQSLKKAEQKSNVDG